MGMEMEIVGYIEQEAGNRKEKERLIHIHTFPSPLLHFLQT